MNYKKAILLLCWNIFDVFFVFGQAPQQPKYVYLNDFSDADKIGVRGPARTIRFQERDGLNMTSIHSVLEIKNHTLKKDRGALSLWFMPLEDLSVAPGLPSMSNSNPYFSIVPFLADIPNPQDVKKANFKLFWNSGYHPNLIAMFAQGRVYEDAFTLPHKALVSVSHFSFKKESWYQLVLTWDYEKDAYSLFINGILIGREDQFRTQKFSRDSINSSLYLSSPMLCFSDLRFYDYAMNNDEIYKRFRNDATKFDKGLEKELLFTYAGKNRKRFEWTPGKDWKEKLALDLSNPSDLDSFIVQGKPLNVQATNEGLLVETINKEYTGALLDSQVYIWTKKPFEGDLYVEFEFMTLRPGGLSLLMVQASGMNREDFMADYPLRATGRMTMVYGEDVRNYHWEYYREMADMRNDVENSALMKNPYLYPLSFGSLDKPVEKNVWHKLQFLQIGNKLIGAVNGIIMVESEDDGFSNNGPAYNFGRISIRCMLRTKMLFRNLKVYNKKNIEVIKDLNPAR